MDAIKVNLRIEEFLLLLGGIYCFGLLGYSWWWFALLLLTPDIGMIGYVINSRIGAFTYNLLHSKVTALTVWGIGIWCSSLPLQLVGIILFCHACMDRVVGYGLKQSDSFYNTHLGKLK